MNNLKFLAIATIGMAALVSFNYDEPVESIENLRIPKIISPTDPPCLQMYFYIEQYADSFNIPKKYAYGIANAETGYRGPFHWRYNHSQTSCAGAVGPMQVMVATARWTNKDNVSREMLKTDIEYNVKTSMKYLRKLHNKYKNWKIVFGCYNTGRPCINGYAEKVFNHRLKW